MIARRGLAGLPLLLAAGPSRAAEALAALEARHGGRLGVAILDTGTGRRLGHRATERFAMCSTFKWLAAAHVLARVDRGEERLDRRIAFGREALVPHAPVTGPAAGGPGLTLAQLCDATITLSDNPAANLILATYGGPAGLTAWIRSLGDTVTRLDRWEPALNEAAPGDPRDTTTPEAMVALLPALLLGHALSAASRAQLAAWMVATKTGDARLRAGMPPGWRVGDKTGTGGRNTTADVGILWPPGGRAPVLVAAYFAEADLPEPQRSAVLAEVGRIAATA